MPDPRSRSKPFVSRKSVSATVRGRDGEEKPTSIGRGKLVTPGEVCPVCDKVHTRCAAHKKRVRDEDGKPIPCGADPVKGFHVCRQHGGKSLTGPAHPLYKTGEYAKFGGRFLPTRYLHKVAEVASDPQLGSMARHIGLTELRIDELLERLEDRENVGAVESAAKSLRKVLKIFDKGDFEGARKTIEIAITTIEDSEKAERETWGEIFGAMTVLRKSVDSERRRRVTMGAYVKKEQVALLAEEFIAIALEYITDRQMQSEFLQRIRSRAENPTHAKRGGEGEGAGEVGDVGDVEDVEYEVERTEDGGIAENGDE